MGRYTAHDDPIVDHIVAEHLSRIVSAVCAHLQPQSIILEGSFGRGEGSVMLNGGQPTFLSDYETLVVTPSPFHRRLFLSLSHQLTAEMGVEVSIGWMRPGRLRTNQPRNLCFGQATPTIATYELREGGQTLYGQEMLKLGPPIDPCHIPVWSGIRLLVNRMTDALRYWPYTVSSDADRLETIRWMNKLVLACSEALLVLWGEYHYSYEERGRRFAARCGERLGALPAGALALPELVERATRFKLRPASNLYPGDVGSLWPQVTQAADAVFRHLMAEELGITFDSYTHFPEQFLNHTRVRQSYNLYRLWPLPAPWDQKLINAIKYLRQRRWPPTGYLTHFAITANLIVFALVPVLFAGWSEDPLALAAANAEVRRWLTLMGYQDPLLSDPQAERDALYRYLLGAWRNFCYQ